VILPAFGARRKKKERAGVRRNTHTESAQPQRGAPTDAAVDVHTDVDTDVDIDADTSPS
jgi:hypothetical protein